MNLEQRSLRICGLPVTLAAADSPLRAALAATLACAPERPADAAEEGLILTARQAPDGTSPDLPSWLSARAGDMEEGEARLFSGPGGACAACLTRERLLTCARFDPETRRLDFLAQKRANEDGGLAPLSVSSVLTPVLREILAGRGRILLHGAGLVLPNGFGVLLLADSGGGKTTTALSLLRLGARLLADDLTALSRENGELRMRGFAEPLNLTPQTIAFFPELARARVLAPSRADGKRVLPADAAYADAYRHSPCRVDALCLLRLGGDAPGLEPLPASEAFGVLVRAHTFARGQSMRPESMAVCAAALEAIPALVLRTGPDPRVLGPWLIERLPAACGVPT